MKKEITTILFFLLTVITGSAQHSNFWYFGDKAGLNFSTSPPTPLLDGQLTTTEGCATVSDSLGRLLFYTDGDTVWNKNHQVMPNGTGLMGHSTSTHSAIVIPKPGSNTIYYVFTADLGDPGFEGARGYRYSEIDMTLNGGLGDINAVKNILLYAPSTEKIAATSASNGIDIWIITKEWGNHVFRTYKVTCNGVDPLPVISTVNPKDGSTIGYITGCMKVSPDGTKIANARNLEGKWDLFKFDNVSGIISDRIMITQSTNIGLYGVEFSPNSQLVYLNGDYTYQYKVDIYDSATIRNSRYQVDNAFIIHTALQLGPDGKIYSNTLPNNSIIANPNNYGAACNYQEQVLSLGGRSGREGYPTFFNRLITNSNVDFTNVAQPNCESINFSGIATIPGPLNWHWDFGDGTTASGQHVNHIFPPTPNQFVVTLTVSNTSICGGSATRSKTIYFDRIAPVADFNSITSCGNLTVNFQNLTTISSPGVVASYLWDFGDGNTSTQLSPQHTYSNFGNYTVTLTAVSADACNTINSTSKSLTIVAGPIANFSVSDTCYNVPIQFTNNSTVTNGSIVAWSWNFGDGTTSASENPTHLFAAPGTYQVTLAVTSNSNCVSTIFPKMVIAGAKPDVGFQLPSVCLLDGAASFTNTTSINDQSGLSYLWYFDDQNATPVNPNTSIAIHPSHQYSLAAHYNVKLVSTSTLGCKDSLTQVFTVNGAVPKAKFMLENLQPICSGSEINIKDSSYVDFGNITKIEVDWGDGTSLVDNMPGQIPNGHNYTHRYSTFSTPAFKNFTITMRSYSGSICVDVYTKNIVVNASPEIKFDAIPLVCNEANSFNLTQASVLWNLPGTGIYSGNGISNGLTGEFNPALVNHGNHLITYSFTSSSGCRTDSSRYITINPTPVAAFNFDLGCLPEATIQFSSNSLVTGDNINSLQHLWNFGDPLSGAGNPNVSNSINPSHIYHSLDSFYVSLNVTSQRGCVNDTIIKIYPHVSIFPQPVADFIIDSTKQICAGSPVYFVNQSDSGGQHMGQYQWAFSSGGMSSLANPNHIFNSHGNYDVSLWIENSKGCRSTIISKPIVVHSIPKSDFVYDSTCYGKPVQFFDRSTNQLGLISKWRWNLGNGSLSGIQNPVTTYLSYQPFTVTLQSETANRCLSAAISKTFTIKRVAVFAGRDTSIARSQPLQLQATGASSYIWTPSIGLSDPTIDNPIATLLNNNSQTYYLKGTTTQGCIGFDTISIRVFDKADIFVPTGFTPNKDGRNDIFKAIPVGIKEFKHFSVYSRSGQLIFKTNNSNIGWDGRFAGELQYGMHVWFVEGVDYNGNHIRKKGTVMLFR